MTNTWIYLLLTTIALVYPFVLGFNLSMLHDLGECFFILLVACLTFGKLYLDQRFDGVYKRAPFASPLIRFKSVIISYVVICGINLWLLLFWWLGESRRNFFLRNLSDLLFDHVISRLVFLAYQLVYLCSQLFDYFVFLQIFPLLGLQLCF